MFAGVAGDFSPLTIEASHGGARVAPPALLVAVAVGLGSMDMPTPAVAAWDWLNWKFPRPVHAGDTIYARWTLTQKRPPAGGAPSSTVVWRVDVLTADGALCAEGEMGASVRRQVGSGAQPRSQAATTATAVAPPRRRRRRRASPPAGAPAVETPVVTAPPVPATTAEQAAVPARRRRRRRSPSSSAARDGGAAPTGSQVAEPAPPQAAPAAAEPGALSRVIRRLRRT